MIRDPWHRNHLIRDAMYAALEQRMAEDDRVIILGEGAEVKVHYDAPSIEKRFPGRALTMPISEDANTNFAVGLALGGMVPVVDVISSDFLYRTMDAICNTAAKLEAVGRPRTIVIKAEFMTGGPTSGQRIESLFTGIPGLSVCCPSNPRSARECMRQALLRKGVTIIFEDRMIEDATTPDEFGDGYVRQAGNHMTVVSYGLTTRLLEPWLADVSCEHLDLCQLYPIDWARLCRHVQETGRLLVVEPDSQYAGIGAEIVANVAEHCPGVKVARMGAPRVSIPSCRDLHERLLPTKEAVLAKCREMAGT